MTGLHLVSLKTNMTQLQSSFYSTTKGGMFQYQSVPFIFLNHHYFPPPSESGLRTKRNIFFSLCILLVLLPLDWISQLFLKQCHWTQIRHAYMETVAFQTRTWNQLFRLYTGVSSADWIAAVSGATHIGALAQAFLFLVWSLVVLWVPLVFSTRLWQKPHVSSGTKHQSELSRVCGGSGLNNGIKGGTILIWRAFINNLFVTFLPL